LADGRSISYKSMPASKTAVLSSSLVTIFGLDLKLGHYKIAAHRQAANG
jgi:hypothetical protein